MMMIATRRWQRLQRIVLESAIDWNIMWLWPLFLIYISFESIKLPRKQNASRKYIYSLICKITREKNERAGDDLNKKEKESARIEYISLYNEEMRFNILV